MLGLEHRQTDSRRFHSQCLHDLQLFVKERDIQFAFDTERVDPPARVDQQRGGDFGLTDEAAAAGGASVGDVQTRKNLCLANQPTRLQSLFATHIY